MMRQHFCSKFRKSALFSFTLSQLNFSHPIVIVLEKGPFSGNRLMALARIFLSYAFWAVCAPRQRSAWVTAVAATIILAASPAFAGVTGQKSSYMYGIQGSSASGESEQALANAYAVSYLKGYETVICAISDVRHADGADWVVQSQTGGADSYSTVVYTWTLTKQPKCLSTGYAGNIFGMERRRVVCNGLQILEGRKCIDVWPSPPVGTPRDNGPPCCDGGGNPQPPTFNIPNPINPATGNMWHEERDYATASDTGLTLLRTYNSNMARTNGFRGYAFGYSWSTKFDARIETRPGFSAANPTASCFRRKDTGAVLCGSLLADGPADPYDGVAVIRGDGKELLFVRDGATAWKPAFGGSAKLTATYTEDGKTETGWTYSTAVGGTERFDGAGRLLSITATNGRELTMTYSSGITNDTAIARYPATAPACTNIQPGHAIRTGLLVCVTDDADRRLQFEYDTKGRVAKMVDPAGEQYLYQYDGASGGCTTGTGANERACTANNLTAVTYPNLGKKTYHYNEYAQITPCFQSVGSGFGHLTNSLTGISDENGARHMYWQYDCGGFASGTKLAENAGAFKVAYAGNATGTELESTVFRYFGDKASNQYQTIVAKSKIVDGLFKNFSVSKSCPECGPFASRSYDTKGRVSGGTDWAGNQTTYNYDPVSGLETSRVEGFGSPVARTITTEWDLTLRRASAIAEPKRITRITYDALGNVRTRTVQATTDQNGSQGTAAPLIGSPRTTTFTYTARGQLESVRGPRTDVVDLTTYTYDSASGAMASVSNALGHEVVFSDFDAHGRPGKTSARGVTTNLYYTNRGWLDSAVVSAGGVSLTTKYAYDLAGLVKTITQPDGTFLEMKYDNAHRLVKVLDNVGNSVEYDLDVLGIRVAERYKDPNGTLARQISRSMNLNTATSKVTGAAQ